MRVLWPLRIDKIGVKQRILYVYEVPRHFSCPSIRKKRSLIVRKQQCIKGKLNHLSGQLEC